MHTLFNLAPSLSAPVMYAQQWNYIRDGLKHNLDRTIKYYRQNPWAVPSDHFLVRLIQSIVVGVNMPLERYYANVDNLSLNLSMALKMTSSIYKGKLHDGVFYGKGCHEILIAHDTEFNFWDAEKNWEDLQPIQVLRHPRSDLEMNLPDGKVNTEETINGLAVIAINIPMLAVQYRSWQRQEWAIAEQMGDSPRSIMQFVHMYLLPNMLYSQLDYAIFNRIYRTMHDFPNYSTKMARNLPFYTTDFSDRVNASQEVVLNNLAKVGRSFTGILRNIPAVTMQDMDQVMTVPDVAPTRQVTWALAIARIDAVRLMLDLSKWHPKFRNGQELNRLRQALRNFASNSVMKEMLPTALYRDFWGKFESAIDEILL